MYSQFENLDISEAKLYLKHFLLEVPEGFSKLIPSMTEQGIKIDYTIESIKPVLIWIVKNIVTLPEKKDDNLPIWITATEIYKKGLYTFDETSQILVLRAAYYFGESFVKSFEKLHWNIGDTNTALQNMPIVSGFKKKLELPTMLVCDNLIRGIIEGKNTDVIDIAVNTWLSFL